MPSNEAQQLASSHPKRERARNHHTLPSSRTPIRCQPAWLMQLDRARVVSVGTEQGPAKHQTAISALLSLLLSCNTQRSGNAASTKARPGRSHTAALAPCTTDSHILRANRSAFTAKRGPCRAKRECLKGWAAQLLAARSDPPFSWSSGSTCLYLNAAAKQVGRPNRRPFFRSTAHLIQLSGPHTPSRPLTPRRDVASRRQNSHSSSHHLSTCPAAQHSRTH
jgi:hypothetical protein